MTGRSDPERTRRPAGKRRPVLRFLETVFVWLLVIAAFAGLGFGVYLLIKDTPARIDENLARLRASTSTSYTVPPDLPPVVVIEPVSEELPGGGGRITNPSWEISPAPYYPTTAMRANVEQGRVALRCRVTPEGSITACEILEETPSGVGFGEAAIESAAHARLRPRTVDGVPVAGIVQFNIRFRLN